MKDDYVDALGIKKTDNVLVYGNSTFVGLHEFVNSVSIARKGSDLTRYVRENSCFTKTIVGRDAELSESGFRKIVSMNIPGGLLCFFVDNEADEQNLKNHLLSNHPWSNVWEFETNVGRVVVSDAVGAPDWVD